MTAHQESSENEIDKDRDNQCLDVEMSSSVRILVVAM